MQPDRNIKMGFVRAQPAKVIERIYDVPPAQMKIEPYEENDYEELADLPVNFRRKTDTNRPLANLTRSQIATLEELFESGVMKSATISVRDKLSGEKRSMLIRREDLDRLRSSDSGHYANADCDFDDDWEVTPIPSPAQKSPTVFTIPVAPNSKVDSTSGSTNHYASTAISHHENWLTAQRKAFGYRWRKDKKRILIIALVLLICLICLCLGIGLGVGLQSSDDNLPPDANETSTGVFD